MEQLAIPLSNQKTVAKWLVIRQQAAKSLVIAIDQTGKQRQPKGHAVVVWG